MHKQINGWLFWQRARSGPAWRTDAVFAFEMQLENKKKIKRKQKRRKENEKKNGCIAFRFYYASFVRNLFHGF